MMFILHLWALRVRGDSVSTRSVLWWPHVAGAAAALQANSPQSCQTGLRPQPPRGSQSPPCSSLRGRTGEELHSHCAHKQPDKDFFTRLNMAKLIKPNCTWVTAESWSSAASSFRATGSPSRLAGGEQVVLLHTVSCFRGAQQTAEALPAADVGAEAAAPVSGATRHALVEELDRFKN